MIYIDIRHIDGNHKLRDFNLVIHAGIDGFSRAFVYISCNDNNEAKTAMMAFSEGVKEYGVPEAVRSDRGAENRTVAAFMLYTRGEASRCFYAGRSTQHQRIERLWRDVRRVVSNFYKTIFYFFVSQYGLDFDNVHVVFCIHYLFLPRINDDLNRFKIAWNSHRIRTNYRNRS